MATKRVFKTAKKLSGSRQVYRKWSEWNEGDILIGKYKGFKEDQYEKPNWLVEVEDACFSNAKEAKELVGKVIGLNSSGQLDKAMEKLTEGQWVQITYNGTAEIEKGKFKGKDAHVIEVDLLVEDGAEEASEEDFDDL